MKLTIVVDDKLVIVDGVGLKPIDMTGIDEMIHAVQWNGTRGDVEYRAHDEHGNRRHNTKFDDVSTYQTFIDRWNVAKVAYDASVAAAAAAKQAAIAATKQTDSSKPPVNVIAN